ncbi:glycosyltransferase [Pollutibacter soli]|uniref:glycosyltransferase n=1 Tax=Pollutibacter soli TaxID=3034157 RepID=UPI0030131FDD
MHVIIDAVSNNRFDQQLNPGFLKNLLSNWTVIFPDDKLSVVTNNGIEPETEQVKIYPVPGKKSRFGKKNIFGQSIPSLCIELKADILFSPFLNTSTEVDIPQILFISSDLVSAIENFSVPKRWLELAALKKQIANADYFIFSSHYLKKRISSFLQIREERSTVIHEAVAQNTVVELTANERIKEKYTGSREYFLYCGNRSDNEAIINMLRGFSAFKKRQQTNMLLVFADHQPGTPKFTELINTYKFRDSIVITKELDEDEIRMLRSAAYAAIFPLLDDSSESALIRTAGVGIPVLCADIPGYRNLDIFSPLYFNPDQPEDINQQMGLIFKNENKRKEMVQQGIMAGADFNWPGRVTRYREIFGKHLHRAGIP